jgi:hypothetical protein
VVVLEARDMRPGKSRPKALAANIYCVVTSVARLRQSSVCWHTPHPVWNEQYFVGVTGTSHLRPYVVRVFSPNTLVDSISVQVLDKSESGASDDLLGVIDVRRLIAYGMWPDEATRLRLCNHIVRCACRTGALGSAAAG